MWRGVVGAAVVGVVLAVLAAWMLWSDADSFAAEATPMGDRMSGMGGTAPPVTTGGTDEGMSRMMDECAAMMGTPARRCRA
jgi:hypothetical protein